MPALTAGESSGHTLLLHRKNYDMEIVLDTKHIYIQLVDLVVVVLSAFGRVPGNRTNAMHMQTMFLRCTNKYAVTSY